MQNKQFFTSTGTLMERLCDDEGNSFAPLAGVEDSSIVSEPGHYNAMVMLSLKHHGHVVYRIPKAEYKRMSLRQRLMHAELTEMPELYAVSIVLPSTLSEKDDVMTTTAVHKVIGVNMAEREGALERLCNELEAHDVRVLHANFSDAVVLRELLGQMKNEVKFGKRHFQIEPHVGVSIKFEHRATPALDQMFGQLKKLLCIYGNSRDELDLVDELSRRIVRLRLNAGIVEGEPHMFRGINNTLEQADKSLERVEALVHDIQDMLHHSLPSVALNMVAMFIDILCLFFDYSHMRAASVLLRFVAAFKLTAFESQVRKAWNTIFSCVLPILTIVDTNHSGKNSRVVGEPHMFGDLAAFASGFESESVVNMFLGSLVTLFGYVVASKMVTTQAVGKIVEGLKVVNIIGPAIRNIPTLVQAVLDLMPAIVKGWVERVAPTYSWSLSEEGVAYRKWVEDVAAITVDTRIVTILRNTEDQRLVEELAAQGHMYFQRFSDAARMNSVVLGTFRESFGKITRLANQVIEARGLGPRTEPFHVSVYGKPGIGKSHLANAIARVLAPEVDSLGVPLPDNMRVYSYTPGSTFMDGYMQQPVMIMDDIHQLTSGDDAIELVRFIGTTALVANMATLDNPSIGVKGTRFTSTVVVSTTNMLYPSPKTVISAEAIRRRRHLLLEARAKNGYFVNKRLCLEKMTSEELQEFAYLEVRTRDVLSEEGPAGPWMSVVQMLGELVVLNEKHQNNEKVFKDTGFTHLTELVKRNRVNGQPHMYRLSSYFNAEDDALARTKREAEIVSWEVGTEECSFHDPSKVPLIRERIKQGKAGEDYHEHAKTHNYIDKDPDEELEIWNACCVSELIAKAPMPSPTQRMEMLIMRAGKIMEDHPNLKWALASIAIFGALSAIIWSFFSRRSEHGDCESHMANPSSGEVRGRVNRNQARRNMPTVSGVAHIAIEDETTDPFTRMVRRNIVKISRGETFVHAFSPCKNIIATVCHFFDGMKPGDKFVVLRGTVPTEYSYEPARRAIFKNGDDIKDIAFYALPYERTPLFRDLRTHLQTEEGFRNYTSTCGMVVRVSGEYMLSRVQHSGLQYSHADARYIVEHGLEYPGHRGVMGECGLPLVVATTHRWDAAGPQLITGLHAGCYVNTGYSETLTKEMVEQTLEFLSPYVPSFDANIVASQAHMSEGPVSSKWLYEDIDSESKCIWVAGKLDKAVRLPVHHAFQPSPITGLVAEPVTDNSVLSPFDNRMEPELIGKSVLLRAHEKATKPKAEFPEDVLNTFVNAVSDEYCQLFQGRIMRVLTWDEAINGIPGDPYIERLNMRTSCGFGLGKVGAKGKRHLFVEDRQDHFVPTPEFQLLLNKAWDDLSVGRSFSHLWKATLKTERRKFEKIRLGKTRQFNVAQVVRILVSRRLNLAFNAAFLATHLKHASAAGMSTFSPEWDIMAKALLSMGEKMFDLDYKDFDGSLAPQILFLHPRIANRVYNDEFFDMRTQLTHELCFRYEAVGDVVYQLAGGNPSGDDCTTIRNSIAGLFFLYLSWHHLAPEKLGSYRHFYQNVHPVIWGDDNVVSVSDLASKFYTPELICHTLAQYFVTATSASDETGEVGKVEGGATFKPIEKCVFLKCGFARVPSVDEKRYVPKMAIDTIHELTNWVTVSLDAEEACLANCNDALRMVFFYGTFKFEQLRDRILKAWSSSCATVPRLLSFDEIKREWRTEQFQYFPQVSPATDAPLVLE